MFDWLVSTFTEYPYLGVAVVFLVCGLGLPLPEELVLVTAGYVCFKGYARPDLMMASCMAAILAGDLLPFFLGRIFGPRILRLRTMRFLLSRRRMAMFDRWFRRRGDLVIFFARFVAGIRMVAYFTAGTMKMPYHRFLILDLTGIALLAPLLVYVGYSFGNVIDDAITKVQTVERTLLIAAAAAAVCVLAWWWLRKRRLAKALIEGPAETFVGPSVAPTPPSPAAPSRAAECDTQPDTQPGAHREAQPDRLSQPHASSDANANANANPSGNVNANHVAPSLAGPPGTSPPPAHGPSDDAERRARAGVEGERASAEGHGERPAATHREGGATEAHGPPTNDANEEPRAG